MPSTLEASLQTVFGLPDAARGAHLVRLARAHPEHAQALWRLLAEARAVGHGVASEDGRFRPFRIFTRLASSATSQVVVGDREGERRQVAREMLVNHLVDGPRASADQMMKSAAVQDGS